MTGLFQQWMILVLQFSEMEAETAIACAGPGHDVRCVGLGRGTCPSQKNFNISKLKWCFGPSWVIFLAFSCIPWPCNGHENVQVPVIWLRMAMQGHVLRAHLPMPKAGSEWRKPVVSYFTNKTTRSVTIKK